MLMTSCIKGLESFWWNFMCSTSSKQHCVHCREAPRWSVTSKQNCVEQSRVTTASDLHVHLQQNLWNSSRRQEMWSYWNVFIGWLLLQMLVRDEVQVWISHFRILHNRLESCTLATEKQWRHCKCSHTKCMLVSTCYYIMKYIIITNTGYLQRWTTFIYHT